MLILPTGLKDRSLALTNSDLFVKPSHPKDSTYILEITLLMDTSKAHMWQFLGMNLNRVV
jgi:hypothetical protein